MNEFWIKGGTALTLNKKRDILENALIHVKDGKIASVEVLNETNGANLNGKVIDATNKIVLPGFVNSHTHADCIIGRGGLSQDQPLFEWVAELTDPIRIGYTEEDLAVAIELYCMEAIRAGTTTITDLTGFREEWKHKIVIDTYEKMGVRLNYCPMFTDMAHGFDTKQSDSGAKSGYNPALIETLDEALKRVTVFLDQDHMRGNGRIRVWVSPRLARSTTVNGLKRAMELAKEYDTMTTTHCAESRTESIGASNTTVEHLESAGYLSERSLLAHCVWVNEEDIKKLSATGTRVAHCPSTNMYLASGFAPVPAMLDAGVIVGLGTDNANANNLASIAMEMREAVLIHKGNNWSPAAITAEEVLEMATINGARAVGLENEIGSIEVGKRADLNLINPKSINMAPMHHIPGTIAYQMHDCDVDTAIVDGKILMQNRELTGYSAAQEQAVIERIQTLSERLCKETNINMKRSQSWNSRVKR